MALVCCLLFLRSAKVPVLPRDARPSPPRRRRVQAGGSGTAAPGTPTTVTTAHRAPPRKRKFLGIGLSGLVIVLLGLAVIGHLLGKKQQIEALNEGSRLWDAGQRDAAVAKYEEGWTAAGSEKPGILKRIVEHELSKGNAANAKTWLEKGVAESLNVPYEHPAALALVAQLRQEHEAQAKQQQQQPEQAKLLQNKRGAKYSRDEFRQLVVGKSRQEVLDLLGRPQATQEGDGFEFWDYQGRTFDPVTNRTDHNAQVEFQNGRVSNVTFVRL